MNPARPSNDHGPEFRRPGLLETCARVYGLSAPAGRILLGFPVAVMLLFASLLAVPATAPLAQRLLDENQLVENATSAVFLLAAGIGAAFAVRLARRRARTRAVLGVAALAALCFVLGMEEISWGQQFLRFRTPDRLATANVQGETTVHNLELFQDLSAWAPLIVAAAGLWLILRRTRPRGDASGVPSPLLPYFAVIALQSAYDNATTDLVSIHIGFDTYVGRLCEVSELLVACAFAVGIWLALRRWRRRS